MLGLFGAAFNPPHNGHLALVDAAKQELGLERLVILVTANPLHKHVAEDVETRLELARAAFPQCTIGLEAATTDVTVREAAAAYGDVIFLIGADQFVDFPGWHDPDAVLDHARLGVATRPGYGRERLEQTLERVSRPERVLFFDMEPWPVASRDLREKVARGEPIAGLTPPAVERLIRDRGLYRP
jgi:nicotinate-nucleotide adenylyltransferase